MMKIVQILIGLVVVVFVGSAFISGIYNAATRDEPPVETQKSEQPLPAPVPVVKEQSAARANAPARISLLPSIGTTRADFDSSYTATNKNRVGYIRYNQDVWHAMFLDNEGDDSDTSDARAYMVTVQVLPGLPLEMTKIDDLIPDDAENVQYDGKGSDNVVTVRNFTGTSEQIKNIFPHSNGKFGGGFNWDAATGNFIGGTIMVDHPFPPGKK